MTRIVCGKYDKKIDLSRARNETLTGIQRIGSKNPNSLEHANFFPIATDGKVIIHANQKSDVMDFFSKAVKKNTGNLIVLTHKERNLILSTLLDVDLDVLVFESAYPIYSHIRYFPDPKKNYAELKRLLIKVRKLGFRGKSLAHYLSTKNQFNLERKVRHKNKLDQFFAYGYQGGYQEVFKIREERSERAIIALDFNSMFSSCMAGTFVEPKSVKYNKLDIEYKQDTQLDDGLYHVILKGVQGRFFCNHHPFKYVSFGRKHLFKLNSDQSVETLLFKNEIDAYSRYFSEIYIIEGLTSSKEIHHPLYNKGLKLYERRLNAKKLESCHLNRFYKFWLVTLHSASNPRKSRRQLFKSIECLKKHLSENFMFNFDNESDIEIFHKLNSLSGFSASVCQKGIEISEPQLDHPESVFSLSSQVLANARVKMIETIEKFLSFPSVEICYANVDSIHLSINKREISAFLSVNEELISEKIGDLKIQCIADRGYWFDIGRYWLFKGDEVTQFKNIIFNKPSSETPFERHRLLKYIREEGLFKYVKEIRHTIENSFSFNKRLHPSNSIDHQDFSRYDFDEVKNLFVAGDTVDQEIILSKSIKVDLFNRVATV